MKTVSTFLLMLVAAVGLSAGNVTVEGAVMHPGTVIAKEGLNVREAIRLAGGLRHNADPRVRLVSKDGTTKVVNLERVGPTPIVHPNTTIIVDKYDPSKYIAVRGAVQQPGSFEFRPGMSLKDAVDAAKPFADAHQDSVTITTSTGKSKEVKITDLHTVMLNPGDRVEIAYNNRSSFTDRELVTILAIVVLVLIIAR